MSKTDKELTVEVVKTYITAWFSKENSPPLQGKNLSALTRDVYKTITLLDKEQSQD